MITLVTGATGFIGGHLVERLSARGDTVRALVRKTGSTAFPSGTGVESVVGDVTDFASLRNAVRGVDVVFHLAAHVSEWGPWARFQEVTVDGAENLLKAATQAGVSRFVHVSTVNVYDDRYCRRNRVIREDAPYGPFGDRTFGHYAHAKMLAEKAVWRCVEQHGLKAVVLRPALVYGPRDRTILPRLIEFLRSSTRCWIGGDNPTVDPMHVFDVVRCLLAAADSPGACGQAYNVAPQEEIGVRDFWSAVCSAIAIRPPAWTMPYSLLAGLTAIVEGAARLTRRAPPVLTKAGLALFTEDRHHDPTKAWRDLGWRAGIGLKDGLEFLTSGEASASPKMND